jgi:hypothetical protein
MAFSTEIAHGQLQHYLLTQLFRRLLEAFCYGYNLWSHVIIRLK